MNKPLEILELEKELGREFRELPYSEEEINFRRQVLLYSLNTDGDVIRLIIKGFGLDTLPKGILNCKHLKRLTIEDCSISNFSGVRVLKKLEYIDFSYNHIKDILPLSNLTNLKVLNLSENEISDISVLVNLTNLEELHLWENQINDISVLENLTNLDKLNLSENEIKDISALENLTNLKELNLSENKIKNIFVLQNLINLEKLDLSNNQINDISALKNLTNLKEFNSDTVRFDENAHKKIIRYLDFLEKHKTTTTQKENANTLNNCILQFEIKNFQGIENIHIKDIPSDTQWIFLTGENGFGKTSILRALVILLFGNEEKGVLLDRNKKINGFIEFKTNGFTHVNELNNEFFNSFSTFAAYGAYRLEKKSELKQQTYSLFNTDGKLLDIENSLKIWHKNPDNDIFYKNISVVLLELLNPYIDQIKVDSNEGEVELKYHETESAPDDWKLYEELASGYKNIIATFGDMILRLRKAQLYVKKAEDLSGIVLIDEFDNHLHPKWQRDLVKKLTDIFPKVQFIVSTHSPIPLLGAPPERTVILNVNRTKEEGITVRRLEKLEKELKYLLPNQLLTSDIFGLEEIENIHLTDEEFDNVPVEDNYNDIEENKKMMQELEKLANNKVLFPDDLFKNKKF